MVDLNPTSVGKTSANKHTNHLVAITGHGNPMLATCL